MKVLLFNLPLYDGKFYTEAEECCFGFVGRPIVPHNFLRIASHLARSGSKVDIIDYGILKKSWDDVLSDVENYDLTVTSFFHGAYQHLRYLAFYEPLHHRKNVIGLCYPEAIQKEVYSYLHLSEDALKRFLARIPGFEKEVRFNYGLYPYHHVPRKVYVVQSATGCRYNCNFCVWAGKKHIAREPKAVIAQLAAIEKLRTPRDDVFLLCSQITTDKGWLRRFVELKEKSIPDLGFFGDIGIGEVDEEIAGFLKRSGIVNATIGAEALSDGWLRKFRKAWTYASIKRGLLNLQKAGVTYHVILKCGVGETLQDIGESMKNLTELVELGIKPEYTRWGKIYPYPGTAIAHLEGKQEFRKELSNYTSLLKTVGWIK